MKKIITLILFVVTSVAHGQTFWSETFNNSCTQLCNANSYTGANGIWTMTAGPGNTGTAPNEWFVSCAENGNSVGVGGSQCGGAVQGGCGVASAANSSLHIGNVQSSPNSFIFCQFGDCGAVYDSGLGAGNVETDKRAISPTINCTGHSGISLNFNYMMGGELGFDYAFVEYSTDNGITWNFLANPNPTGMFGGLGLWAAYSFQLPVGCDNNPNVKIAFHWVNDDNGIGGDPSFAVDNISLGTVFTQTVTTGSIAGGSFCSCVAINVPFTSTGTFAAGNNYTVQLSDASGNFGNPVTIGTLSSTANSGTISCIIPCNTPAGSGYLIRVNSSNPTIVGSNNGVNISINTVNAVPVCLVSVDALSTHNIVVWEKTGIGAEVDSFRIYREVMTNVYSNIASVSNDSLSEYHDIAANPNVTSYKYKIAAMDTCGGISPLSDYHNTIHLQYLGNGNLQWTLYEIENAANPVNFYIINRDDTNTGNFLPISSTIPGTNSTFTDINYSLYPNAAYRADVIWSMTCTPTRTISSTHSNISYQNSSVSVSQTDFANFTTISPNPFSSQTTITFSEAQKNTTIKITDVLGNVIQQLTTNNRQLTLDMSGFAKGIYFVRITDENKNVVNRKIVLN